MLYSFGYLFGVFLMLLMILALAAAVISRYIFNDPIFWTGEFARIVLIWTIFVGAALALKRDSIVEHISMDFFVARFQEKNRKVIDRARELGHYTARVAEPSKEFFRLVRKYVTGRGKQTHILVKLIAGVTGISRFLDELQRSIRDGKCPHPREEYCDWSIRQKGGGSRRRRARSC